MINEDEAALLKIQTMSDLIAYLRTHPGYDIYYKTAIELGLPDHEAKLFAEHYIMAINLLDAIRFGNGKMWLTLAAS